MSLSTILNLPDFKKDAVQKTADAITSVAIHNVLAASKVTEGLGIKTRGAPMTETNRICHEISLIFFISINYIRIYNDNPKKKQSG
jgi:hypothetical protein